MTQWSVVLTYRRDETIDVVLANLVLVFERSTGEQVVRGTPFGH
jgi:hypothetical protein